MPTRRHLDTLRPGFSPDLAYGLGRDYAVTILTRRAFSRCGETVVCGRESSPQRYSPYELMASRRPPC